MQACDSNTFEEPAEAKSDIAAVQDDVKSVLFPAPSPKSLTTMNNRKSHKRKGSDYTYGAVLSTISSMQKLEDFEEKRKVTSKKKSNQKVKVQSSKKAKSNEESESDASEQELILSDNSHLDIDEESNPETDFNTWLEEEQNKKSSKMYGVTPLPCDRLKNDDWVVNLYNEKKYLRQILEIKGQQMSITFLEYVRKDVVFSSIFTSPIIEDVANIDIKDIFGKLNESPVPTRRGGLNFKLNAY